MTPARFESRIYEPSITIRRPQRKLGEVTEQLIAFLLVQSLDVDPGVRGDPTDDGLVEVRADDGRPDEVDVTAQDRSHRRQQRLPARVVDDDAEVAVSDGHQERVRHPYGVDDVLFNNPGCCIIQCTASLKPWTPGFKPSLGIFLIPHSVYI